MDTNLYSNKMNPRNKKLSFVFYIALTLVFLSCESKIIVDEYEQLPPEILGFSPASGEVNTEITITGQHLQAIDVARIGGVEVPVKHLISDTSLLIIADRNAVSGKIELIDRFGRSTTSQSDFSYTNRTPDISGVPSEVNIGDQLILEGNSLNSITGVFAGDTLQLDVLYQTENQIVIQLPLSIGESFNLTVKYLGDTSSVEELMVPINVKKIRPAVNEISHDTFNIGDEVTLTGTSLHLVESITYNDVTMPVMSTSIDNKELKFNIVDDLEKFAEGDNLFPLIIHSGDTSIVIKEQALLTVYPLYSFKSINMSGQHLTDAPRNYFINLETGIIHDGDAFDKLDPVTIDYDGDVCSASNVSNVTKAEYDSVDPYFFFREQSRYLYFHGPAHNNGSLVQYRRSGGTVTDRIISAAPAYGTPIIQFRVLDKKDSFEKSAYDIIKSGDNSAISSLFEDTFLEQIDLSNDGDSSADGWSNIPDGRVISLDASQTATKRRPWAQKIVEDGGNNLTETTLDPEAVVLVLYYHHEGLGDRKSTVKKYGFLDIYNYNQTTNSSSTVDMNIYWKRSTM